jgi:hypothetical protein
MLILDLRLLKIETKSSYTDGRNELPRAETDLCGITAVDGGGGGGGAEAARSAGVDGGGGGEEEDGGGCQQEEETRGRSHFVGRVVELLVKDDGFGHAARVYL